MRVSHLLKCIGFALAVPLVLCVGLVVFALTPWGLQTGVSLAQKFLPELSVGNVNGTLFDADISEIRYQTTPVTLELKRVQLSIANLRPGSSVMPTSENSTLMGSGSLSLKARKPPPKPPSQTTHRSFCRFPLRSRMCVSLTRTFSPMRLMLRFMTCL